MQMPKQFSQRMTALAEDIPSEVIGKLLVSLLPRVPVATRPADPDFVQTPSGDTQPRGFRASVAKRRRAVSGYADYRVVDRYAHHNHRSGTWRYAMVRAAVESSGREEALATLAEEYPRYADRGIDFAWCEAQGYITTSKE